MFRPSKKFIAVLMLLWLPLFCGNALAVSLSMQLQHGQSSGAGTAHMMMDMEGAEHHCDMTIAADEQNPSCNDCELCHLACTGYLAAPDAPLLPAPVAAQENTPYLLAFHSVVSAPLVPPPLSRA